MEKVSKYTNKDFERLMNDMGIIRNRLKIKVTINNAKELLSYIKAHLEHQESLTPKKSD